MDETNDEEREDGPFTFMMYSLSRHKAVRRAVVADGAVGFEASEDFIMIVRVLLGPHLRSF
jgi:hypothetical protein